MKKKIVLTIVFAFLFCFALQARAQEKMAISITPPLIKNNVSPGQIWKSYIKVVNNNPEDIDIYVELINFESGNETGTVRLTPKTEEEIDENEYLINNWLNIDKGPIHVPAYKSKDIPFIVDVPEQADPGDHHLAILIGTEPNKKNEEGSSIKISSKIGSLLLLNVAGDTKESGIVREFSADKNIYSSDNVKFAVRFQNTGNTILQPRGEIRIYNWQEKDQGVVNINHKTETGNVFPEDTRLWNYNWEVPTNILKMGRYKADLILAYGNHNSETVERVVYFWVIQWKPVLISLSIILFLVLFLVVLVRRYIRKAVLKTQEQIGIVNPDLNKSKQLSKKIIKTPSNINAVVDLKTTIKKRPRKK